ncbi:hypothetical protein [Nostoc sp.]
MIHTWIQQRHTFQPAAISNPNFAIACTSSSRSTIKMSDRDCVFT